ncbi:GNAT family N-acetyltransferase [Hymenobacter psychrophilus]|uniref:Protein N-acetyltransferase, RimJ/RimL family n=1 Tax=Hymenobacter psychrophilus TaxID=651662 RepID=A0A1H3L865_9BACT|nr:GNAT family N-acetyltransferase [Hymenobacter psychrophilus]SDY60581.1 Protein N-acetyltransferase, RimJ/RimL family [Hymenobacter psychrophilus]
MPLTLRPVAPADLPTLLPLMADFYQHFGYAHNPAAQQALVAKFVAHPEWGTLYLLDDDGRAMGYVALTYGFTFERGGRYALVDELYVTGAARSQGVGHAALLLLQQLARAAGLVALYLQTESYNASAQRLYESVGFVDDGRRNLAWLSGS